MRFALMFIISTCFIIGCGKSDTETPAIAVPSGGTAPPVKGFTPKMGTSKPRVAFPKDVAKLPKGGS